MKALKKAWVFLLLVCLAALFSTVVLADDNNIQSGTCGDNLTWVLEDGVLTISGEGEMENYGWDSDAPWYSQRDSITAVVIEDGATSIGEYAFYYCSSLTSATMPDSITTIGDSAFYECRGLSSITIPDGVTSIGSLTFYRCTSLTSVTIPASVTFIGDDDYDDQSIVNRYHAFTGCRGLTEFVVSEGSATYCAVDGVLFSKDKTILLCYPAGKADNSYVVPNGVIFIGCCAFSESTNLTSVTIPDGVTYIGNDAFSSCSSLTSMKIPSGVTEIGSGAFSDCRSLSSITIPSSVTYIGDSAFRNCTSLTDVYYRVY